MAAQPTRLLTLFPATVVGVAAMVGTGVFVAWNPAYHYAGSWLLLALLIAAGVASFNALSNARMARIFPVGGGGYVYGRECVSPVAGQLAGWFFLVGKAASASAAALAIGVYVLPEHQKWVAVASIGLVFLINAMGVRYSVRAMVILLSGVLTVLLSLLVVTSLQSPEPDFAALKSPQGPVGVLAGAGILFVAFAGYARIAVMGSDVEQPQRTIPRAMGVSLVVVLVLYSGTAMALISFPDSMEWIAPVEYLAREVHYPGFAISAAAALAAGSALFALLAGMGRMVGAMSLGGHLPRRWGVVNNRRVPVVAEAGVAVILVGVTLAGSISINLALSAIFVLGYYGVIHLSSMSRIAYAHAPVGRGIRWGVPLLGLALNLSVVTAILVVSW
ncbi:MAG: amino acid permease [Candidatus Nanopelagicales bacterium]|nr:amino acid permease [Candidatus Nanopelagicales bacterium]MCF8539059.1 amino acid permease [Candidatus Nanopelagicales bacterium]MCF8550530.1 amino acid permease [Candidatus Nanopelagicales bacterium]